MVYTYIYIYIYINTLENDKHKIKSSPNVFIFADKTRNVYEMNPSTYDKLLTENITKTYKLAQDGTIDNINCELKERADELKITNRVEKRRWHKYRSLYC